jgi:hypothetical protein
MLTPEEDEAMSQFPGSRQPARYVQGAVEIPGANVLSGRDRACDADRNRYIDHLSECHRLGYIPADVFHARMAAAAEAVTVDQLARLIGDLRPLPPPRPPLRSRLGRPTARRWLHIIVAAACLCVTFAAPAVIYSLTGYQVTYGSGSQSWTALQHSGPAIAVMWLLAILGITALAADIGWWIRWESDMADQPRHR